MERRAGEPWEAMWSHRLHWKALDAVLRGAHSLPRLPTQACFSVLLSTSCFQVLFGGSSEGPCCLLGTAALRNEIRLLTTFAWFSPPPPRASPWVALAYVPLGLVQEQCKFMSTSCQGVEESWRPGHPDYFIFLRLSQVFLSPVSCFHILTHLSVSSSLYLTDLSPVQLSANIPRKSRLGLLTRAPVRSWDQGNCSGIPVQLARSQMPLGKLCHLSEPPFLPLVSGAGMPASQGGYDVTIA